MVDWREKNVLELHTLSNWSCVLFFWGDHFGLMLFYLFSLVFLATVEGLLKKVPSLSLELTLLYQASLFQGCAFLCSSLRKEEGRLWVCNYKREVHTQHMPVALLCHWFTFSVLHCIAAFVFFLSSHPPFCQQSPKSRYFEVQPKKGKGVSRTDPLLALGGTLLCGGNGTRKLTVSFKRAGSRTVYLLSFANAPQTF